MRNGLPNIGAALPAFWGISTVVRAVTKEWYGGTDFRVSPAERGRERHAPRNQLIEPVECLD
eukprot:1564576-Prymnesium_polylepis.1